VKSFSKWAILLVFAVVSGFSATITEQDTARVNHLLRKARSIHYSNPDSAVFFYENILSHTKVDTNLIHPGISDLEKAYLVSVIRAQNYIGNIYYYNDEYNRADYYYRRSLTLARKAGFSDFTANSLYDVGYTFYVTNSYKKAAEYFKESYEMFYESDNNQGMFDAIQAWALAERHLGNLEQSDSCYRRASALAAAIGDSTQIADVQLNNGILLCELGNLEEGTRLFQTALDYYDKKNNREAVSLALLNIGVVMKMLGEFEKAEDYILRSAAISEALQQKSQLVIRYSNLADLYMEMKRNETAFEYCNKTLSVASEIGAQPFITECNLLLGKFYYLEGNYDKAREFLAAAAESVKKTNDKPMMINVLLWSSRNLLEHGKYSEAIRTAREAFDMAEELMIHAGSKDVAMVLSQAYEKNGQPGEALFWQKQYQKLSDSLNFANQHKEITRIEAKYNYDKKEKENEILRNKATLQEQKLRSRTIVGIAFVTGLIFSIIIIILLVRRSRDARLLFQQQQMLNLKHLEELENELDGKNRELTSKMMFLNQKNDLISRLMRRLQEIRDSDENSSEEILSLVNELRSDSPQSSWKEFETQFIQVHPGFYQRLFEKHPALTSYEQRICAFLRMNLNTKEISSITGRSAKSIEVARSRIRTKLELNRNENLSSYLAAI